MLIDVWREMRPKANLWYCHEQPLKMFTIMVLTN